MKKFYNVFSQLGQPPGNPVYSGQHKEQPVRIRLFSYDADHVEEQEISTIADTFAAQESETPAWVNIEGLHDESVIQAAGEHVGLHSLIIEDILHTHQRPRIEELDGALYLVVRMLSFDAETGTASSEQVSFILHGTTLLTFQERPGDVFESIRTRLRQNQGRIRKKGADYLLYALMDAITDNYFIVIEKMGEQIEAIEAALMTDPYPALLTDLYALKREVLYIRKSVWPLREAIGTLDRGENELINAGTRAYLRDLYDHTIQVIDTIETFRDMVSGVQDLYLSSLGNKTNQVMKVLTIISTIFIPITFIAGIYGMNFEQMPELKWRLGYPATWGVMIIMTLAMLAYFRRKKWL